MEAGPNRTPLGRTPRTGVLMRRQRNTRSSHGQKKKYVKTQQEGSHLQAKERHLNRKQPCQHLNGLAASITEKINFCHLVIPTSGIVMAVLANKILALRVISENME